MNSGQASITGTIFFLLFGPIVWSAHLLVIYGGHASLCAAGERLPGVGVQTLPWLLWGATLVALALLALVPARPGGLRRLLRAEPEQHGERRFITMAMRLLSLLSFIGVSWAGVAVLVVPDCAQMR